MELEPEDAQDARVERLWQTLDTRREGQLDLNGLKKGLKKIDHRTWAIRWGGDPVDLCSSSKKRRWSASRRVGSSRHE